MDRMIGTLGPRDRRLADPRVLSWDIGDEDIQRVEIGAYRALLIHGDEIGRGGQVSINTIINHAKGWRSGAYPWPFQDIYAGHFHSATVDTELPWGRHALSDRIAGDRQPVRAAIRWPASSLPTRTVAFR